MRDYKNVKVPRKYRSQSNRVVKRVEVSRSGRKTGKGASGIKQALFNIFGSAALAACCWTGWQAYAWLTHAQIFQITGVDVKGVRQLGEADLKSIVGGFTGRNIFRVDLESAVERARANPWIKDARIHRSLPNRISMAIEERSPYAVLDTDYGKYLIDNEAVVIDRVAKADDLSKPLPDIVIRGYRAKPGEPVTAESIPNALDLLSEIEARGGWEADNVTIKAETPETVSVVYGGLEFKMGSGNYSQKLRRLSEVMQDVKQRNLNIAYADLRPERQAAVMLIKAGGAKDAVKSKPKRR